MKSIKHAIMWLIFSMAFLLQGSAAQLSAAGEKESPAQSEQNETNILQSWQGDYPVARLELLPEKQRKQSFGFIDIANIFEQIWKAFRPGEDIPEITVERVQVFLAPAIWGC